MFFSTRLYLAFVSITSLLVSPSLADIEVKLREKGANSIELVVSGSVDVSAFNAGQGLPFIWDDGYSQSSSFILVGNGDVTRWDGFDVQGLFTGSNNTDDLISIFPGGIPLDSNVPSVGILPNALPGSTTSGVYLPTGYAGEFLSGSTTFESSFAELGMIRGQEFSVTWNSNGEQKIVFQVVPEPAIAFHLALGSLALVYRRRK